MFSEVIKHIYFVLIFEGIRVYRAWRWTLGSVEMGAAQDIVWLWRVGRGIQALRPTLLAA